MTTYLGTVTTIQLVPMTCGDCGVVFAFSQNYYEDRRRDRQSWHCPNGHRRHFVGPTADDKLREAEAREVALRDQLEAAAREAETVRVALLRDRQRFANGVCPCCNRSFDNVRRHMATKHPDYDTTKVASAAAVHMFACACGRKFETLQGLRIHQSRRRSDNWWKPGVGAYWSHLTKV